MSTSTKAHSTIRQGGPGASPENAKAPLAIKKPGADNQRRRRSKISGGGEKDSHRSHHPRRKSGGSGP